MQVVGGVIHESQDDVKMAPDFWTRQRYASATAGGHGSSYTTPGSTNVYGIGSSFGNVAFDDDDYTDEEDAAIRSGEWDKDYRSKVVTDPDELAMAMLPETNTREVWEQNPETGELELTYVDSDEPVAGFLGFYVELEDGSIDFFETIDELESSLSFLSQITLWDEAPFPTANKRLRWTNFVRDMGHITVAENQVSWLRDFSNVDLFESPALYNLSYIREGLNDIAVIAAI